ncbi:hypothetical protein C6502_06735 [Candidatus Poribacteria bacterium]|nr:MAG: hypothetical protein C6502_06735 [Candidatus Poribacteria bacterium]
MRMKQFLLKSIMICLMISCIGGGLLLGATFMTRSLQNTPPCKERTQPDCPKDGQTPTCPKLISRCPLSAADSQE